MEKLVLQVLAGEQVDERKRRLITPGTTLGGARPKALLDMDDHPWVLKLSWAIRNWRSCCAGGELLLIIAIWSR